MATLIPAGERDRPHDETADGCVVSTHLLMTTRVISLALFALTIPLIARADLLKVADFEMGDLSQLGTQKALPDAIEIVTDPVRAGRYAAKSLLRATDPEVHKGQ